MRQLGVSLPPAVELKLKQVAKAQGRSMSSIGAEAITAFLAGWIAEEPKPKRSLFSQVGVNRNDIVRSIQESA